ncbi:hypothetical protein ABPG72_018541 [Tetrahymena utriculariae]
MLGTPNPKCMSSCASNNPGQQNNYYNQRNFVPKFSENENFKSGVNFAKEKINDFKTQAQNHNQTNKTFIQEYETKIQNAQDNQQLKQICQTLLNKIKQLNENQIIEFNAIEVLRQNKDLNEVPGGFAAFPFTYALDQRSKVGNLIQNLINSIAKINKCDWYEAVYNNLEFFQKIGIVTSHDVNSSTFKLNRNMEIIKKQEKFIKPYEFKLEQIKIQNIQQGYEQKEKFASKKNFQRSKSPNLQRDKSQKTFQSNSQRKPPLDRQDLTKQ